MTTTNIKLPKSVINQLEKDAKSVGCYPYKIEYANVNTNPEGGITLDSLTVTISKVQ